MPAQQWQQYPSDVFSKPHVDEQSTIQSTQINLKYAPHDGMFRHSVGENILDQLSFMADQGFTAFEDNGMSGREPALQEKMGKLMAQLGIAMGVFVAHKIYWSEPNLASGKADKRAEFLTDIRNAVEVAKRCSAKWMTVVPGHLDLRQNKDYQTAHVVESIKRAAAIPRTAWTNHGARATQFRDHPGLYLTDVVQSDLQGSEQSILQNPLRHLRRSDPDRQPHPEHDAAWDEIAYFQIGDNPGRKEPTTGEINYKNIFKHIHAKGYTGILGMEHGNSRPDKGGDGGD